MSKKRQRQLRQKGEINYLDQLEKQQKRNRLLFVLIGLVIAITFGFVIYFYVQTNTVETKDYSNASTSTEDTTTEDADDVPDEEETETEYSNSGDVPDISLADGKDWDFTLELTQGTVKGVLFGDLAPQAVSSFIYLADENWYPDNKATCTRVTTAENFQILQCGGPNGDQAGGPGYSYGPIENAPTVGEEGYGIYPKGYIAMARQGDNGYSMGSQFFIMYGDTYIGEDSAGGYSIVGEITEGLEVIEKIAAAGTADGSEDGAPKDTVDITGLKVSESK